MEAQYNMAYVKSRQIVNRNVKSWDRAIEEARTLLERAEARVARLKGAISTFVELRDCGHAFDGPDSPEQIEKMTQLQSQNLGQQHNV